MADQAQDIAPLWKGFDEGRRKRLLARMTPEQKKNLRKALEGGQTSTAAAPAPAAPSAPSTAKDWRDPYTEIQPHQPIHSAADLGREVARGVGNIGAGGLGVILRPVETAKGVGQFLAHPVEGARQMSEQFFAPENDPSGAIFAPHALENLEGLLGQAAIMDPLGEAAGKALEKPLGRVAEKVKQGLGTEGPRDQGPAAPAAKEQPQGASAAAAEPVPRAPLPAAERGTVERPAPAARPGTARGTRAAGEWRASGETRATAPQTIASLRAAAKARAATEAGAAPETVAEPHKAAELAAEAAPKPAQPKPLTLPEARAAAARQAAETASAQPSAPATEPAAAQPAKQAGLFEVPKVQHPDGLGEIRAIHGPTGLPIVGGEAPTLPGMEEAVKANRESAQAEQGRALSAEMTRPPESISKATGEMERNAPLFAGSEANPQRGLFGEEQGRREQGEGSREAGAAQTDEEWMAQQRQPGAALKPTTETPSGWAPTAGEEEQVAPSAAAPAAKAGGWRDYVKAEKTAAGAERPVAARLRSQTFKAEGQGEGNREKGTGNREQESATPAEKSKTVEAKTPDVSTSDKVLQTVKSLESGPGNYVRIDQLREHVPGIADEQIIALADRGKLVLAHFDGPFPVSDDWRRAHLVTDNEGESFVGAAIPRGEGYGKSVAEPVLAEEPKTGGEENRPKEEVKPKVYRDFEQYAAEHGASRQDYGDAALHRSNSSVSKTAWSSALKAQAEKDAALTDTREALRKEYQSAVDSGAIREMTAGEKMRETAAGHEDNESVQAAKRLLDKQANRGEKVAVAKPKTAGTAAPAAKPEAGGKTEKVSPLRTVPREELHVDPQRFQYKMGTNKKGVTGQFADTKKWDPDMAGVLSVWRDPEDGKLYVVNGHHRFEMAERFNVPELGIREIEAKDASEARLKGAVLNIADDKGTALDAAKFFRETGEGPEELERRGLTLSAAKAANGLALARLDPRIFDDVVSGKLKERVAIAIGSATDNALDQETIVRMIEGSKREVSPATIEELARRVKSAGTHEATQETLFGPQTTISSLILEENEISSYIQEQIKDEKRLFAGVAHEGKAKRLGVAGNVINVEGSAAAAKGAAQANELYNRLSTRAGAIDDILKEAAGALAEGKENPNAIKSRAYEAVRAELVRELGKVKGTDLE